MRKAGAPEDRSRCCYVHPVYSPEGIVVTDDFPKDHYHHRGIFWTWPIVIVDGVKHDAWLIQGVKQRFAKWHARETGANSARLAVENGWFVGDRKVVREDVEIIAEPTVDGGRTIRFRLRFEAVASPVELRGEPAENKGYGGFCVRFAPRKDTQLTSDKGVEAKDTNMTPHEWARLEGTFEGRRTGLSIAIDHANPGFPNGWCLRHYGFLGVNYPGLDSFVLHPGQPLELKYRVFLGRR
jgi:hypothetical protein